MLLDIRENMQGWVVWVIVALISLTFALFGLSSYLGGSTTVVVAKVNGTEIELRSYQNAFEQHKRRLRTMLGKNYSAEFVENPVTKRAVLDNLVEQELITQYVDDAGYGISDSQLLTEIMSVPEFKKSGKFDKKTYKQVVNSQRMTEEQFEAQVRNDMVERQFKANLSANSLVTKATVDQLVLLQNQTRKARFLKVTAQDTVVNKEISTEDLAEFYQKSKESYMIEEAVKVSYVRLSVAMMSKEVNVSDEAINKLYEQQKERLKTDELRKVSHIMLVSADESADVLAKANKIKTELESGKDFAEIAKAHSEDLGSALKGGDLGYKSVADLEPEISKAVFAMKSGELSQPIKTKFGYHVVKVTAIKSPQIKELSEVKEDLLKEERLRLAQELFFEKVDQFSNLAYEQPDSLDSLKEALALASTETDWVARSGGAGVFSNDSVMRELFSEEVLKDGQNTTVIELSDEDYIVLRVLSHREKSYKTLEEVKETLTSSLLAKRQEKALTDKGQEIIVALEKGQDLPNLANSWDEAKLYTISGDLDEEAKALLFTMAQPAKSQSTYKGTLSQGKFIIVALDEVANGKPAEKAQQEGLQAELKKIVGDKVTDNFIASLKAKSEVKVFYNQILDEL